MNPKTYFVFILSDPCPPLPHVAALKLSVMPGDGRRVRVLCGK
jgi:hypothetical protein